MKEATEEEWTRLTTDKFKACVGCKHRFKDKNAAIRKTQYSWQDAGVAYGCGFGQLNMTSDVEQLPEQCRLRNMKADTETYRPFVARAVRNNCQVCMVYMDMKPTCQRKDIRLKAECPCKTCEDFMVNDKGCMNFKAECESKLQYEVIREG